MLNLDSKIGEYQKRMDEKMSLSASEVVRHSESKDEVIAELTEQNETMLSALKKIDQQPHHSTIDGMMSGWARGAIKEYYRIERKFLTRKTLEESE